MSDRADTVCHSTAQPPPSGRNLCDLGRRGVQDSLRGRSVHQHTATLTRLPHLEQSNFRLTEPDLWRSDPYHRQCCKVNTAVTLWTTKSSKKWISSRLEQLSREASGGGSAVYPYDPQKGCPVFSPHSSSVYAPILLLAFTLPVVCVSLTSKKPADKS
jgi:hypothetical protein